MLTIRGRVRPAVESTKVLLVKTSNADVVPLGQGIGKSELVAKVVWLKSAIEARGGKVADFGDMTVEEVVDRSAFAHTVALWPSSRGKLTTGLSQSSPGVEGLDRRTARPD